MLWHEYNTERMEKREVGCRCIFSSQSERMTLLFVLCCSEEEDWHCNTDHQLRRRKRKVGTGNKRGRGLCRKLFFKGEVMGIPAGIEKIQKKKIQKKEK